MLRTSHAYCAVSALVALAACASAAGPVSSSAVPPSAPASSSTSAASVDAGAADAPPVTACTRLAIAFVIDRSGSMMGAPIDMAKAGASAAIDELSREDCVAVLAFDSKPSVVVPVRVVDDREAIKASIATTQAGGGTDILSALAAANTELSRATRAARSHVVLLTDGQSAGDGIRELAVAMAAKHITITTIAVGADADTSLLRTISETGSGRYYRVSEPSALLKLFAREVTITRATP